MTILDRYDGLEAELAKRLAEAKKKAEELSVKAIDAPRRGKLIDPVTCSHFAQDIYGHCSMCGAFSVPLKPKP